jgi:uncharacterized membrane protein (DUF485 family)
VRITAVSLGDPNLAQAGAIMAFRKNAPTGVAWFISFILYLVALMAHFRVFRVSSDVATWSWIIGFGLLLLATQMRRL